MKGGKGKAMNESVVIALEVYLIAFVAAFLIAVSIKAMQAVIRRIAPKKETINEGE